MEQIIEEYGVAILLRIVGTAVLGGFQMLFQMV